MALLNEPTESVVPINRQIYFWSLFEFLNRESVLDFRLLEALVGRPSNGLKNGFDYLKESNRRHSIFTVHSTVIDGVDLLPLSSASFFNLEFLI